MARPPATPRLATLIPSQVAADVCAGLLAQIAHLDEALAPIRVSVGVDKPAMLTASSRIGQAVQRLVRRAQGEEVDGDPVADVERLLGVDAALEPTSTPLGVALAAATCRGALSKGRSVTVRELAALGGLDPNALRSQVRAGKAQASGRGDSLSFGPAAARAWLEGRGIKA